VWNGERILPDGWTKFVSTLGPVQPADNGPRYGGQFWVYSGMDGLPALAYSPNGGQGQYSMIIPSHKAVIVRRGFDAGGGGFRIPKFCADVLAAIDCRSRLARDDVIRICLIPRAKRLIARNSLRGAKLVSVGL
jgi:CubicO group peptidase (beta-lactamase class C family)